MALFEAEAVADLVAALGVSEDQAQEALRRVAPLIAADAASRALRQVDYAALGRDMDESLPMAQSTVALLVVKAHLDSLSDLYVKAGKGL